MIDLLPLQSAQTGRPGAAYNLGNRQGFSVREVRVRARDHRPRDPGHPRPQTPRRSAAAGRGRAPRTLGWELCYASLSAIIESAWRWYQKKPEWAHRNER